MFRAATTAFCIFSMIFGPGIAVRAEQPITALPETSQAIALPAAEWMRATYSISGLEDFADFTKEQWLAHLDTLSDADLATLKSQVIIGVGMNYGDYHWFITSTGNVEITGENFFVSGIYQWLPGKGLVIVLTDQDNNEYTLPLWQQTPFSFMYTNQDSETEMVTFGDLKNQLWQNGVLNLIGFYRATIDIDPVEMSLEGGSFVEGERALGVLIGLIGAAVGGIALSAKCIKDALWDAYDCTPGTIACDCNGCEDCSAISSPG